MVVPKTEIKMFCKECKQLTTHFLTGIARHGYMYECNLCGRVTILSPEELEFWQTHF